MIEKNQLSELYLYMEKNRIVGEASPETIGKVIAPSERNFLISETQKYIFKKFPMASEAEIHIAGSLSENNNGVRKSLYRKLTRSGFIKKEDYSEEMLYIPSDLHYISDLDIGIVSPELFSYISVNWQEAIGPLEWGISTVNIDTRHTLGEGKRPKFWESIPGDLEKFILNISDKEYAGRRRPLEIKFFERGFGTGTIEDANKYIIRR